MFIRKRKNKSGSTSIQIVEKIGKSLKVKKHIGTALTLDEQDNLYNKALA